MLWYKAWLETRSRFLISLIGIVALCSYIVFHGDRAVRSYRATRYFYWVLSDGHQLLAIMWILAVTLLMMGGLVREKASGASPFTLALPVSRTRLIAVRIGMGFLQAMALVIVPWSAMFLLTCTLGKTHSFAQTWFYILLLAGGGLVFFALAVLISSLFEGEYTAPVVSFGIVFAVGIVFDRAELRPYSPWTFVMGTRYMNWQTYFLREPIPWLHLGVSVCIAVLLLMASVKIIQKREF